MLLKNEHPDLLESSASEDDLVDELLLGPDVVRRDRETVGDGDTPPPEQTRDPHRSCCLILVFGGILMPILLAVGALVGIFVFLACDRNPSPPSGDADVLRILWEKELFDGHTPLSRAARRDLASANVEIITLPTTLVGRSWDDVEAINGFVRSENIFKITLDTAEAEFGKLISHKDDYVVPVHTNNLDLSTFATIVDKDKFTAWIRDQVGLADLVPRTYGSRSEVVFPAMLKPLVGTVDVERRELYAMVEKEKDLDDFLTKHNGEIGVDFSCSEFVKSRMEDSIHFVFADEKFIRLRQHRRWATSSDIQIAHHHGAFGSAEFLELSEQNPLVQQLARILTSLRYRGIGCFDLKYSGGEMSRPKILELNPRICGTMTKFDDFGRWARDWVLLH